MKYGHARLAILGLTMLGATACGLGGVYFIGAGTALGQRVEHAQRLGRHVPHSAVLDASDGKWLAITFLASCVLGIAGGLLVKRPRWAAAPLLVAGIAPIPFALWAICPASPLAIAGLIAFTAKPPDPDVDASAAKHAAVPANAD